LTLIPFPLGDEGIQGPSAAGSCAAAYDLSVKHRDEIMRENAVVFLKEKPVYFSAHPTRDLALFLIRAEQEPDISTRGRLLRHAVNEWPQELDAHILLYKFLFFHGRHLEAERAVLAAMSEAARQGGFSRNYRRLKPQTADWLENPSMSRVYLFSLKALGVVRLRRGRVADAERVLTKLLELDPQDEIGGRNFLDIATSFHEQE